MAVRKSNGSTTPQTIINSTLAVMAEEGFVNLTTKRISKHAEVSTATIHYFFDTKEKLIESAFAYLIRSTREEMIKNRRTESDPLKRIKKAIELNFSAPMQLTKEAANYWPSLWISSLRKRSAKRLVHINSRRLISNFTYDIKLIGARPQDARRHAITILALVQGLWIEYRLDETVQLEPCLDIFDQYLQQIINGA